MTTHNKEQQSRCTNKRYKTTIKNLLKRFRANAENDLLENAKSTQDQSSLSASLQRNLDKAANKGIIHRNKAKRLKSKIQRSLNTQQAKKSASESK